MCGPSKGPGQLQQATRQHGLTDVQRAPSAAIATRMPRPCENGFTRPEHPRAEVAVRLDVVNATCRPRSNRWRSFDR